MDTKLTKRDIKDIVIESIMECGGDHFEITDIDNYEIEDYDDKLEVNIDGSYETITYGAEPISPGILKGILTIYKDDKFIDNIKNKKLCVDHFNIQFFVGGTQSFNANINEPFTENLNNLNNESLSEFYPVEKSLFSWHEFLNDDKVKATCIDELKNLHATRNETHNSDYYTSLENVDDLVANLESLNIIEIDICRPKLNEDYNNTFGKALLPAFVKKYNNMTLVLNDNFILKGKPNEDIKIDNANDSESYSYKNGYIYLV